MKELCTTIFKIFGIYQLIRAIDSSGEIPLRIYLSQEKDAETYLWIIQDMFLPLVLALLVFTFAGKLASFIAGEPSEINMPSPESMLPVAVFFLGLYLFTVTFPSLVSGMYNIYTNEFPNFKGMHTQGAIFSLVMLLISITFITRPKMFGSIYSKVAS